MSVPTVNSQNLARHLADKIGTPPKTLPWTDKFCHFVRFGMAKGQGLRAKGKKDTKRGMPEVALPSLSPQPLALSHYRHASCVMRPLNSRSQSRQEIGQKSICQQIQTTTARGLGDLSYENAEDPSVVSCAVRPLALSPWLSAIPVPPVVSLGPQPLLIVSRRIKSATILLAAGWRALAR